MKTFTQNRGETTPDELWTVEHPPVFTLGRAADPAHVLAAGAVPVVRTERGGQVTYHGPGQLVAYPLLDLRRRRLGVKDLVNALEQAVIDRLGEHGLEARRKAGAPGVYVGGRKIAAVGLRVTRGCTFHGLAFNLDMDLKPFRHINPCGYEGLEVTQLADHVGSVDRDQEARALAAHIAAQLGVELQDAETPSTS